MELSLQLPGFNPGENQMALNVGGPHIAWLAFVFANKYLEESGRNWQGLSGLFDGGAMYCERGEMEYCVHQMRLSPLPDGLTNEEFAKLVETIGVVLSVFYRQEHEQKQIYNREIPIYLLYAC